MTAHRDPDELIHRFLLEGSERLHDQVYDAVRAEIERKRQRAVIGPWRMPDIMNRLVAVGGSAAALVIALVVGAQLLGGSAPGGAGSIPSNEPSPTPSPTASPAPTPSRPAEGELAAGPHVLARPGPETGPNALMTTVTIPGPGWAGEPGGGIIVRAAEGADPPSGAGMIGPWFEPLYVYGNPCSWSTTSADAPVTTVDALMAALQAQELRDASEPVDITLGGYPGKGITLRVPDDADFSACDQGYFGSWTIGRGLEPYRYHQGPGQIDEIWAADVDGRLVVHDWAYYEGTPQAVVDELRAIVASMTFGE